MDDLSRNLQSYILNTSWSKSEKHPVLSKMQSPILVPTDDLPKPHWHFWFAIESNFNQSTRVHHLSVKCGNLIANEEEKLKFSVLEKSRMLTVDNWIEGKPHTDGFVTCCGNLDSLLVLFLSEMIFFPAKLLRIASPNTIQTPLHLVAITSWAYTGLHDHRIKQWWPIDCWLASA